MDRSVEEVVEVSVFGAGDDGGQLVLGEDEGVGLAVGRGQFVVLEADQAAGRGEGQAAGVAVVEGRLHVPAVDHGVVLSVVKREVGVGVKVIESQLLRDWADKMCMHCRTTSRFW